MVGAYSKGHLLVHMDLGAFEIEQNTLDSEKEKLEDQSCWQMKAKIGHVVLANCTAVTNDIKYAEVPVQKLEEEKK